MDSFDVIIIGGGIVGCACARACAREGMRVAVVEANLIGGGATAAAMGHIVVMDDSQAQLELTSYSRALWNNMRPQLPTSIEYESCGTLWVAADEDELQAVSAKRDIYAAAGIESSVLDAHDLEVAEPNLRRGLAGGLLVPDDAVIYPPTATAFLLEEAMHQGVALICGHDAVSVSNKSVKLSNSDGYKAERIIIATGAATSLLPWLPIQKRKGHLLITDRYPDFAHHQLVELGYLKSAHALTTDSVAFNVQPRSTGQILIGSSRQFGIEDSSVDQTILTGMIERACSYMPGLATLKAIRAWTGFRAATPDKLPIIGPTDNENLFVALGFEGLGITNALGAAQIIADGLMHREAAIDATPFLPARFASVETAPV